jgi:tetratricopeptide (TPR) repeat protein
MARVAPMEVTISERVTRGRMSIKQNEKKIPATIEARRLAEVAKAAGLGDSPDVALRNHREALALLGTDEPTPLLSDVLRWQGSVLVNRGRTSDAEPLFRQSLAIAEQLDYTAGRAHGYNCLAGLAQRRGDMHTALELLRKALDLAEQCGEVRLTGSIHQNLGILADIRGDATDAFAHYRVAMRVFQGANDDQRLCWLLINLGYLHAKEQRYEGAESTFVRGLAIARERGDLMSEGFLEENRAEAKLLAGYPEEAYASIRRALQVAELRRDDVRRAAALKLLGAFERLMGRYESSVETLRHALTLSTLGEDALLGAEVLYQFGQALHAAGDARMATEVWEAALEAFQRIAAQDWIDRTQHVLTAGPSGRYL